MTVRSRRSLILPNAIRRSMAYPRGAGRHVINGYPAAAGIPPGGDTSLVFDALTYDPNTYEMLGVKSGIGGVAIARGSERYVLDYEGVYRLVPETEPAWSGGRVVQNVLRYSEDFSNVNWSKSGGLTVNPDGTIEASGVGDYVYQIVAVAPGGTGVFSFRVNAIAGTIQYAVYDVTNAGWIIPSRSVLTPTGRISVEFTIPAGCISIRVYPFRSVASTEFDTPYSISEVQFEDSTGRADPDTPSEYCPTDTPMGDELVTNGEFDVDSTGWIDNDSAISTVTDGEIKVENGSATFSEIYQVQGLTQGSKYLVSVTHRKGTANARLLVRDGGLAAANLVSLVTDSVTLVADSAVFVATANDVYITFGPNSGTLGDYAFCGEISIKEASTGYKVYSTQNGNSVASNVVTEGVGAPLPVVPWLSACPPATNVLLNSNVVGSQGVTLAVGTWSVVVHVNAGDNASAIVTSGTATATGYGTATPGSPIELDVTVEGTVNVEITGTPFAVNLLNLPQVQAEGIAPIPTEGTEVSVQGDGPSLDLANHNNTRGAYYLEWLPDAPNPEAAHGILNAWSGGPQGMLYDSSGVIRSWDSTTFAGAASAWVEGSVVKVGLVYDAAESLFRICMDGVWGAEAAYDGDFFTTAGVLQLFFQNDFAQKMRNLQRYDLPYAEAQAKIDELMN